MMILTVTLFITLAVFANSSGSPGRLPNQVYRPKGPASTSGRNFEESTNIEFSHHASKSYYDTKGIFYEENGKYYPVRRGIPLIEHQGLIVGRYKDDLIAPIFNSVHKYVVAYPLDYNVQFVLDEAEFPDAMKQFHVGEPMPPDSRIVNLLAAQEPAVKVRPHDREVNSQTSALSKKFGKSGKKSFKCEKC